MSSGDSGDSGDSGHSADGPERATRNAGTSAVATGRQRPGAAQWALRPAAAADVEPIADLRALVMRPDLERLGRYDEHRVRQRFRDSFDPRHTAVVTVAGGLAGSLTVRPADGRLWLEHFYLAPHLQGRGLGSAVLRPVLDRADAERTAVGLNVLQGSPARRLYERHGFVVDAQDPVDVFMTRLPAATAR